MPRLRPRWQRRVPRPRTTRASPMRGRAFARLDALARTRGLRRGCGRDLQRGAAAPSTPGGDRYTPSRRWSGSSRLGAGADRGRRGHGRQGALRRRPHRARAPAPADLQAAAQRCARQLASAANALTRALVVRGRCCWLAAVLVITVIGRRVIAACRSRRLAVPGARRSPAGRLRPPRSPGAARSDIRATRARRGRRCAQRIVRELEVLRVRRRPEVHGQGPRAGALQRRAGAVRLRRLARLQEPLRMISSYTQLLARRYRASSTTTRMSTSGSPSRSEAHAGADQRPAGLFAGRGRGRARSTRTSRRQGDCTISARHRGNRRHRRRTIRCPK